MEPRYFRLLDASVISVSLSSNCIGKRGASYSCLVFPPVTFQLQGGFFIEPWWTGQLPSISIHPCFIFPLGHKNDALLLSVNKGYDKTHKAKWAWILERGSYKSNSKPPYQRNEMIQMNHQLDQNYPQTVLKSNEILLKRRYIALHTQFRKQQIKISI